MGTSTAAQNAEHDALAKNSYIPIHTVCKLVCVPSRWNTMTGVGLPYQEKRHRHTFHTATTVTKITTVTIMAIITITTITPRLLRLTSAAYPPGCPH